MPLYALDGSRSGLARHLFDQKWVERLGELWGSELLEIEQVCWWIPRTCYSRGMVVMGKLGKYGPRQVKSLGNAVHALASGPSASSLSPGGSRAVASARLAGAHLQVATANAHSGTSGQPAARPDDCVFGHP